MALILTLLKKLGLD